MTQEEFSVILPLCDLFQEWIDGSALDDPVQGESDHDGGGRPLGERIENRGESHETSLAERNNPFQSKRL